MNEINQELTTEQLKQIGQFFMKKYHECNNEVKFKHLLYSGPNPCMFLLDEHMKYYRIYKKRTNKYV